MLGSQTIIIKDFLKLFVTTGELGEVLFVIHTLDGFNFSGTVRNNQTIAVDIPITFEVHHYTERHKGIFNE